MEKIVKFEVGHNCIEYKCKFGSKKCIPNEGGSHGLSGMLIRFVLKGDEGAVQFLLSTPFVPTEASYMDKRQHYWMPYDLGYHAKKPQYEGQTPTGACEFLDGADCFYDGSGLNAEDAYKTFSNAGEDDLWRFLEEYYRHVFNGGEYPEIGTYKTTKREG